MKAFLRVFLPLLIAYGATLAWCMERWNAPSQNFAHAWLVPLVGAFVVWHRRRQWGGVESVVDRRGWWLLGPGLALHFAGALLMVDSWSAASLVLAIPGAAWLALGTARLRGLWAVLWLGLFLVPMPMYLEGRLAFELKEVAVAAGSALANFGGADVVRLGDRLQPRGLPGSLWVAPACSGLRSLLAMLTLAYCLAFFVGSRSWVRRAVLLCSAPLLAIFANTVRIAVLCWCARWFGVPFAEGTGHTLANGAEWLSLLACLWLIDSRLARPSAVAAEASTVPIAAAVTTATTTRKVGLGLWLAAAPLLALSLYRPFAVSTQRADALPAVVAGHSLVARTDRQEAQFQADLPSFRERLGTNDFVWRHYHDGQDSHIHLVALFHDTNWKSVHPPRICIEGSNMDIETDDLLPAPWLGDEIVVSRIVAKRRSDQRRFVTLSLFGTRDWLSGDYWQFTWHHLPRALMRANMSGFLLRVETSLRPGEDAAAAARRCQLFLAALVPMAKELLR